LESIRTESSDLGTLSFFESQVDFPFEIKRIYYIYEVEKDTIRGKHAHKNLKQIMWCPFGKIEIEIDTAKEKNTYVLDSPEKVIILSKGYWRTMKWIDQNSVLCVAASDFYKEEDYIRNYEEYLKFMKRGY
jgi:dTDP-4-dehydrorhamnose 3,5-epimerase-like enzyme